MSRRAIFPLPQPELLEARRPSSVVPVDDGGPAPNPLSIPPPPNTAGYTTRTITQAEAEGYVNSRDTASQSRLILELDDATDYVISSPLVIRRPVDIRGGRNIVWKGAHIQLNQLGVDFFPGPEYLQALKITDGASAQSGRIIHLEGHWYEGDDLAEGVNFGCPTAHIRMGYWRVSGATGPRSTDAADGTNMYTGVGFVHSDVWKANSAYLSLTVDRSTIETSATGWRFDRGENSTNILRRCNVRAMPRTLDQEGPLGTESQTWTQLSNRADFEASQGGFTGTVGGADSLTYPYTTSPAPLSGTQSLLVTCIDPAAGFFYGVSRTASLDWSNSGNATALSCLVHIIETTEQHPMMRIDVSDSTLSSGGSDDYWYIGQSHKCTVGVTRRLVCPFPREVLAAIRKVRIVQLYEETGVGSGTHQFIVDDIASGQGVTNPTFTGPVLLREGTQAIRNADATEASDSGGLCYLKEFYGEPRANNTMQNAGAGDGTTNGYDIRHWDGDEYILDPPPGDATLEDYASPAPPSTGNDGTAYVTWSATVAPDLRSHSATNIPGSARMYQGPPAGGDWCPAGIAGQFYSSPSVYINEPTTGIAGEADSVPTPTVVHADSGVTARRFDGTDDRIGTDIGSVNQSGAFSMAVLVRNNEAGANNPLISHFNSGLANRIQFLINSSNLASVNIAGTSRTSTTTIVPGDGWVIVGFSKASGTATGRFHIYKAGSWTHENASGTHGDPTADQVGVNFASNFTNFGQVDLAVAGEWTSALSDGNFESLSTDTETADWTALSPAALWEFDQASTTDDVLDLIGTAHETAITGTTVIADGPVDWDYEVAAPQTVNAGVATESDTAPDATKIQPQAPVAGGVANESDTALAAARALGASVASEADSAPAATTIQPQAPVSGGVASEADAALAATKIQPQAPVSGGVASEADAALAATKIQPQAPVSGGVGNEADSAPSATVQQAGEPTVVSGGVASEADSAPAAARVLGASVAAEVDSALAASIIQPTVVSGGVSSETDAAIAATVLGGALPPDMNPPLGGVFIETNRGGVFAEVITGAALIGPTGGAFDESVTGGAPDEPDEGAELVVSNGGVFDESTTGGEVF